MTQKLILSAATVAVLICSSASFADEPQREPGGTTIMGPINTVPNGGRPEKKIAFPEIKDWKSLRITLDRGMCLGACPSYTVEIDGDGTVTFDGDANVVTKGKQTGHISERAVHDLFDRFRKAEYFWSLDIYSAPVTDFPSFMTSIAFDGQKKTITDYVGKAVGMPSELIALEDAIDAAAGTDKWIGSSGTH